MVKALKPLVMMQLKDKIDLSFLKSKKQTITKVILSAFSANAFSNFLGSTFPFKGISNWVSFASSIVQSKAVALRLSICPFVVSKWELPGTMSPCFTKWENNTFSAARPWCVGITYSNPVIAVIVSFKRKKLLAPA